LDGKNIIPGWLCILSGILYATYHLFDLMDGKHARNTKTSSPLGLLMDHGCDALTTFLFLMSFGNILRLGNFNLIFNLGYINLISLILLFLSLAF